jgi:hypothetical protein
MLRRGGITSADARTDKPNLSFLLAPTTLTFHRKSGTPVANQFSLEAIKFASTSAVSDL